MGLTFLAGKPRQGPYVRFKLIWKKKQGRTESAPVYIDSAITPAF